MTKNQILSKIEGLQRTRQYAAPEMRPLITAKIAELFKLLDKAE